MMRALSPKQIDAVRAIERGRFVPCLQKEEDGWHARWRALGDDNPWIDDFVRSATITPLSANAEEYRHETLHDAWLQALKSTSGLVVWDDNECAQFAEELEHWSGNALEDAQERKKIVFCFSTEGELFFISCRIFRTKSILRQLGQAAYVFAPLRALKSVGEDSSGAINLRAELSRAEAESFLRSGAKDLVDADFVVEGCEITARVSADADVVDSDNGGKKDLQSFVARLVVRVDGEVVDAEEIRFLLEQKSTLVFFRNRWIEVDRNILKEALRALERQDGKNLSVNEAVAFASGIGFAGRMQIENAKAHGWLRGLINSLKLAGQGTLESIGDIDKLNGELRDYQKRGVAWIKFLTDNGFGALLADDMGLGKTIQTITWLLLTRQDNSSPALIIAPLTLLSNWKHEIARFAPSLKVYVHQGSQRQLEYGFARAVKDVDVVITSYSLLVRDYSVVRHIAWSSLVLDEAQALKNPDTRVAKAAIALGVPKRLALTGTPVENSVSDIWSLQNILNPGFLGDRKSFDERFTKVAAQDEKSVVLKRLSRALEPFVLRRVKSDKAIQLELGEKREIKEYCVLSAADRNRYEAALEEYRLSEHRRGDMFGLLTRLKIICDGQGKMDRLCELLESIFLSGESALIFTQYAKVAQTINAVLLKRFGRKFPLLHGALTMREREREIKAFTTSEGPDAFILSLRAGAFGLNLTKASHVIHFDRWWNPAVESQATDRAHRIGQTKTVFVHSFITEGTLEERVDQLLERKSRVAGTLIVSGESFISSLTNEEFDQLVALEGTDV